MEKSELEKYLKAVVIDGDKKIHFCLETLVAQGLSTIPMSIYNTIKDHLTVPIYNTTRKKLAMVKHFTGEEIDLDPGYDILLSEVHVYHDTLTIQLDIGQIGGGGKDHRTVVYNVSLESLVDHLDLLGYLRTSALKLSVNMITTDFSIYTYGRLTIFHTADAYWRLSEGERVELTSARNGLRKAMLSGCGDRRIDLGRVNDMTRFLQNVHCRLFNTA